MGLVAQLLVPSWSNFFLFIGLYILYKEIHFQITKVKVPIVGVPFPGWIGSFFGGLWFVFQGHNVIRDAYKSGKYTIFQVALLERMQVVVTTKELIDEICCADPKQLSFLGNIDEDFQVSFTMSREVHDHLWHIPLIHDQLTKKLMKSIDIMRDELVNACDLFLGTTKGETVEVNALETVLDILTRLANRYFVGLPLCRTAEYLHTAKEYAKDVAISGVIIRVWPEWMKPLISRIFSRIPKHQKIAMKYLAPMIEYRRKEMLEPTNGKTWTDRPDDYLQWLLEGSMAYNGNCDDTRDLMLRLMFLNFAGIHTSGQSFVMVLYQLLSRPEYIPILLEEATTMIEKYGYTVAAYNKMSKIDSFSRECSRYVSLGPIICTRKALIPYTLSNGIHLPLNTQICMPHHSIHNDATIYKDPDFNGLRFHELREELAAKNPDSRQHEKTNLWTATSNEQLFFGYGRHPCPGRFFASTQSKILLSHLLMTYKMELDTTKYKYTPHCYQTMYIPNLSAGIKFTRLTEPESQEIDVESQ